MTTKVTFKRHRAYSNRRKVRDLNDGLTKIKHANRVAAATSRINKNFVDAMNDRSILRAAKHVERARGTALPKNESEHGALELAVEEAPSSHYSRATVQAWLDQIEGYVAAGRAYCRSDDGSEDHSYNP